MKKLLFLIMIWCLMMPIQVLGHSYVGTSSPSDGEVVQEPLQEIHLEFDAGIEQHTSIDLMDDQGNSMNIKDQVVEDRMLIVTLSEPLYYGSYTMYWTALGSDGHTTEGTIVFSVDALEYEVEADHEEMDEVEETESSIEEELINEESDVVELDHTEELQETSTNGFFLIIVIVVVVIAAAIILGRRRK